jgi:integrase
MRALNKLGANAIPTLPPGKHEDGMGLRLIKREDGSGVWVFRYTIHGRRREMGLGAYPTVTLKNARADAAKARTLVARGIDPIAQRDRERDAAKLHTLEAVCRAAFEARKAQLKNDDAPARWFSPLQNHVLPRLGRVPVTQLTQNDLADCLRPIWHTKAPTAEKALDRVGLAIRHAAAMGLDVDLALTLKTKSLLGAQRHEEKHHAALPWVEVPALYAKLGDALGALALKVVILTGARSGSVRVMRLSDIDRTTNIWTVPAADMKGGAEWRCPLSAAALRVIDEAVALHGKGDDRVFPASKGEGVVSDMTMLKTLNRMGVEARPHGFRTSLRVWLAEATDAKHEVAEMCLAHQTDSKAVRAYRRSDFIEQRAALLARWADHVTGKGGADVVRLMA